MAVKNGYLGSSPEEHFLNFAQVNETKSLLFFFGCVTSLAVFESLGYLFRHFWHCMPDKNLHKSFSFAYFALFEPLAEADLGRSGFYIFSTFSEFILRQSMVSMVPSILVNSLRLRYLDESGHLNTRQAQKVFSYSILKILR